MSPRAFLRGLASEASRRVYSAPLVEAPVSLDARGESHLVSRSSKSLARMSSLQINA